MKRVNDFLKTVAVIGAVLFGMSFVKVHAEVEIRPYSPPAQQTFQVDGKTVNVVEAMVAYKAGKKVFKCTEKKTNGKIILADGKVVSEHGLTECKEQVLAQTRNGIDFKVKK